MKRVENGKAEDWATVYGTSSRSNLSNAVFTKQEQSKTKTLC